MRIRCDKINLTLIFILFLFLNSSASLTREQRAKISPYLNAAYSIYLKQSGLPLGEDSLVIRAISLAELSRLTRIDTTVTPFTIRCGINVTAPCEELSAIPGVTVTKMFSDSYAGWIRIDKLPNVLDLSCVMGVGEVGLMELLLSPGRDFSMPTADLQWYRDDTIPEYLILNDEKIEKIKELLSERLVADKIGPKLRAEIDIWLQKKENHTFSSYVHLVQNMTYVEQVLLFSSKLSASYYDFGKNRVKANFLLSTLPMVLNNPLVLKIGISESDCETIKTQLPRSQLQEAKRLIDSNREKILSELKSTAWCDKTNDYLLARLYFLQKSKVEDDSISIYVFLLEEWSRNIIDELEKKGFQYVMKHSDYVIRGKVTQDKVDEVLTSELVVFGRLTNESNSGEVFEWRSQQLHPLENVSNVDTIK